MAQMWMRRNETGGGEEFIELIAAIGKHTALTTNAQPFSIHHALCRVVYTR